MFRQFPQPSLMMALELLMPAAACPRRVRDRSKASGSEQERA